MHTNTDAENNAMAWSCERPTRKWEDQKDKQTEFINGITQDLSAGRTFL